MQHSFLNVCHLSVNTLTSTYNAFSVEIRIILVGYSWKYVRETIIIVSIELILFQHYTFRMIILTLPVIYHNSILHRLNTLMDVVLLGCRCACKKLHNFVQVGVTILLESELLHCRPGILILCLFFFLLSVKCHVESAFTEAV